VVISPVEASVNWMVPPTGMRLRSALKAAAGGVRTVMRPVLVSVSSL
jgi:hypothetical protein